MFFQYVRNQWEKGYVSIGLSSESSAVTATFEARGITYLAIKCLSAAEQQQLVEIAKHNAIAKRDAGTRPLVIRKEIVQRLGKFSLPEIHQAHEILAESNDNALSLEEVRRIWNRVSVALDQHKGDGPEFLKLQQIEFELSLILCAAASLGSSTEPLPTRVNDQVKWRH